MRRIELCLYVIASGEDDGIEARDQTTDSK